jgi:hypothetical protein
MTRDTNRPPQLIEKLLRILLPARDKDTVAGDLLEEYREVVLPKRGRLRAHLWYVKQAISLVDGVTLGLLLGLAFGLWNLFETWINPLAEDTPVALLTFYVPMFAAWAVAAFNVAWRSGRVTHAIRMGVIVALATFVVFYVANILRVNLFLETIRIRSDWYGLLLRFDRSGFGSFRAFVNYEYITGVPFGIGVVSGIGAAMGSAGGIAAHISGRIAKRVPQ